MVTTFKTVWLYSKFTLKTSSSPDVYTEYNENSLHKPVFKSPTSYAENPPEPPASELRYSYSNVTPRKGEDLSVMELPIDHAEFESIVLLGSAAPTFILIEVGHSVTEKTRIAGWIDRTEAVATKGPNTNTRIFWHVDYYLTSEYMRFESERATVGGVSGYDLRFSYGQGTVKRGPESMKRPDPSLPRKWVVDKLVKLLSTGDSSPWFVLAQAYNDGSHTFIRYIYWHVGETKTIGGQSYGCMPAAYSFQGWYDEYLGIDPDTVIGVWASPVAPFSTAYAGTIHGTTYFAYVISTNLSLPEVYTVDLRDGDGNGITANDNNKIQIVDPTGAIYGCIPWGYTVSILKAYIDIGPAGANLVITFDSSTDDDYTTRSVEGLTITVPLPAIPVTSNAASSYYYSGEREYDQTVRALQRQQSAVEGITGSAGTALGGAIAGAMIGGPGGAVVGGIAGLGMSVIGTSANAIIGQEYDKKSQEAVDKLKSKQAANVINMTGGSAWWSKGGVYWKLVVSVRDTQSAAELSDDQTERGYITDAWVPDCSSLIAQGGPLRIEGLEIKGSVPIEFKQYLAALFARGVHLDILT